VGIVLVLVLVLVAEVLVLVLEATVLETSLLLSVSAGRPRSSAFPVDVTLLQFLILQYVRI